MTTVFTSQTTFKPVIGFLIVVALSAHCNRHEAPSDTADNIQAIKSASTIEDILAIKAHRGYQLPTPGEPGNSADHGVYNLNDGHLQSASVLVIESAMIGCAPCKAWIATLKERLAHKSQFFDPEQVSFLVIQGADRYCEANAICSFPDFTIKKRVDGHWVDVAIDWGVLGQVPENADRLFDHVRQAVRGTPIPPDKFTLSNSFSSYEVFYPTRNESKGVIVSLARSRGARCQENSFGVVCRYDLNNIEQLRVFLLMGGPLRFDSKTWPQGESDAYDDEEPYTTSYPYNALSANQQTEFKGQQREYIKQQKRGEIEYLKNHDTEWTSLFVRAETFFAGEFDGSQQTYWFPGEIGERTKALLKDYMERNGHEAHFYEPVLIKDIPYFKRLDEEGIFVLPHNVPRGLLQELLDRGGNRFIYPFSLGFENFAEFIGLAKFLKDQKDCTLIALERGPTLFIPHKHEARFTSTGNSFPESWENIFWACIWINGDGRARIHSVDGIKETIIDSLAGRDNE